MRDKSPQSLKNTINFFDKISRKKQTNKQTQGSLYLCYHQILKSKIRGSP